MQEQSTNIINTFAISQFDEYYLQSINRNQFEHLNSKTQYDAMFKQDFSQKDTLHLIVGMDSGLLANYVMDMELPAGSRYIFIELDAVLNLLKIDLPQKVQHDIKICSPTQFDELITDRTLALYIMKGNYKLHHSIGAASNHLEAYTLLGINLEQLIQQTLFNYQIIATQKAFVKTQLENISENRLPASILKDRFKDMSCIIIAGGPSLNEHIDWIKSQSKNLIIIAISRVASLLYDQGVTPDIIVSVDPQDFSFELNSEMMALHKASLLVQSYHLCPRMSAQWQGRRLYLGKRLPWATPIDIGNIESIGPTVTNSAVHLAIEMGFSRLLLCGVDFCHSKSGFTHAQGTIESNLGPNLGQICEWVDTYSGEQAETLFQLLDAIESLQDEVKQYPERTVINLAKNAAVVEGISYQTASNIQLEPIPNEKFQVLREVAQPEENKDIEKDVRFNIKELTKKIEAMQEIVNLSIKAIQYNTKVIKLTGDKKSIISLSNKIEDIEQTFNKKYHSECHWVKVYGYSEFAQFLTTKDTDSLSQEQLNERTSDYYQAFKKISSQLLSLLTSTLERCESRLLELRQDIDIKKLAAQWRKDNQQGRVRIWRQAHPDVIERSDRASIEIINELEVEYQKQLDGDRKDYVDSVKETSTLERAFIKIMGLVNSRHHTGLKQMATCLRPIAMNDDETNRLYHLSYGHQLHLEERYEEALACMLELPERLITEPETKLIIQLSLKLTKLEHASRALKKATSYSDEYLPRYANVLRLQGQTQEAVNTYLDYLDKYPSDLMVWLKFGSFMFDIDQIRAAVDAFSHVIQSDPDNQVALSYLTRIETEINASQDR